MCYSIESRISTPYPHDPKLRVDKFQQIATIISREIAIQVHEFPAEFIKSHNTIVNM